VQQGQGKSCFCPPTPLHHSFHYNDLCHRTPSENSRVNLAQPLQIAVCIFGITTICLLLAMNGDSLKVIAQQKESPIFSSSAEDEFVLLSLKVKNMCVFSMD